MSRYLDYILYVDVVIYSIKFLKMVLLYVSQSFAVLRHVIKLMNRRCTNSDGCCSHCFNGCKEPDTRLMANAKLCVKIKENES